jgi:hypothetical protein
MPLLTIYDLREDHQRIRWLQEATLTTRDLGLEPTHGLFGSADRWRNVARGHLPTYRLAGVITNTYNIGDSDHPEFSMVDSAGIETTWNREVNRTEDDALYIVGRMVELAYVMQRRRVDLSDLGIDHTEKCILSIKIEASRARKYRSGNTSRHLPGATLERALGLVQ